MIPTKFAADFTYRTPQVTIDYKAGMELPTPAEIRKAAIDAGAVEPETAKAKPETTKPDGK